MKNDILRKKFGAEFSNLKQAIKLSENSVELIEEAMSEYLSVSYASKEVTENIRESAVVYKPVFNNAFYSETDMWKCWQASKHYFMGENQPLNFIEWLKANTISSSPLEQKEKLLSEPYSEKEMVEFAEFIDEHEWILDAPSKWVSMRDFGVPRKQYSETELLNLFKNRK
jgi:hypothetical protein